MEIYYGFKVILPLIIKQNFKRLEIAFLLESASAHLQPFIQVGISEVSLTPHFCLKTVSSQAVERVVRAIFPTA